MTSVPQVIGRSTVIRFLCGGPKEAERIRVPERWKVDCTVNVTMFILVFESAINDKEVVNMVVVGSIEESIQLLNVR